MSIDTKTVTLIDGRQAGILETFPGQFEPRAPTVLQYQLLSTATSQAGPVHVVDQDQTDLSQTPLAHTLLPGFFDSEALTGGGFEVVYDARTEDNQGIEH